MPWKTPKVWIDGPQITAADLNSISENLRETAPAKAVAAGDIFYATGPNTLGRLAIGSPGQYLNVGQQLPQWGAAPSPITEAGDLVVGDATGTPSRLEAGSAEQVLAAVNGVLEWRSMVTPSGTVSVSLVPDLTTSAVHTRTLDDENDQYQLGFLAGSHGVRIVRNGTPANTPFTWTTYWGSGSTRIQMRKSGARSVQFRAVRSGGTPVIGATVYWATSSVANRARGLA